MIKNRKAMLCFIGIAILVIGLVGITYAFFNYTRTGSTNVVKVGRIYFNSTQGNAINLDNVFPIDKAIINSDTNNVGSVTIHITGDTTYSNGIEYLVTAMDVSNTVNNKIIPIGINVDYVETNGKTIGIEDNDYYTNRGGNTSVYYNFAKDSLKYNGKILVGYIKPDETGIDGSITIKAYLDKDQIAISDTYPEYTHTEVIGTNTYEVNSNMSTGSLNYCINTMSDIFSLQASYIINPNIETGDINSCVSYFNDLDYDQHLQSGETLETFCDGTGTIYDYSLIEYANNERLTEEMISDLINMNVIALSDINQIYSDFCAGTGTITFYGEPRTFQVLLNYNFFNASQISDFKNHGVIIQTGYQRIDGYTNGTTSEWARGRTVLTTEEWNSLQTNGVSFHIKVEANEGIWVEENSVNAMDDTLTGFGINNKVKEIYFVKMEKEELEQRYNQASYKKDVTYNNEGQVLEWLEVNDKDNTKYNLYVASDGETYLTKGEYMFFSTSFNNAEVLEMNNVNISRLTSINKMFTNLYALKKIDLRNIKGFENIETMYYLFDDCSSLEEVNMSGLDLSNVKDMQYLFKSCTSLKTLYLNNIVMNDILKMNQMFYWCTSLEEIDLSNLGGNNLNDITQIFNGCTSLKRINMTGFNFGNADISYIFQNMQSLELIDLTDVDMSNIQGMSSLFSGSSLLTTIYVSNTWDTSSIDDNTYLFDGCTSIVGGNGTTYDSSKYNKEYARIDGANNLPGYLSAKTS